MLTSEQRARLQHCLDHHNRNGSVCQTHVAIPISDLRSILASAAPASDSAVFDALEKLAKGFTRPTDRQFMRHVISTTRALLNEATGTVNADA